MSTNGPGAAMSGRLRHTLAHAMPAGDIDVLVSRGRPAPKLMINVGLPAHCHAELSASYIHPKHDLLSSMEYGRGVTMPSETELSGELLLVAIVEMSPGQAAAGQRYEDTVLGLLGRHGGSVERRMRGTDSATEVQLIRFRSRAGYESFMVDPNRLGYRDGIGDAAPTTRVIEVRDL